MNCRNFILGGVLMMLGACASSPAPRHAHHRATAPRASSADVPSMNSQRDIVLAVANPLESPTSHAGSSLLGYPTSRYYGAGEHAASVLKALKLKYRLHELTGWPIKPLGLYCVVLEPPPDMARDALLNVLAADRRVQLAQPLQHFSVYSKKTATPHQYNDPYVNLQRGFVETDASLAQNISQGKGVHVAIVDTGVDITHPDLQGRIHDVQNMVDDNVSIFNRDAHGTEVAGVIAADGNNHQGIVGIAPKVLLSVYKACWYPAVPNTGARCNSFTLAKALTALIDTDTRIINLSLGGPADPLLQKLLALLLDQGRIVVAALPPSGSAHGFPDDVPGVFVVRTSSASRAPQGVLSAPGDDILTAQPDGGYDFTSGSSMAAAHVSGMAALMLFLAPKLSAHDLHDLLLRTSTKSFGMVQVNAAAAVDALYSSQQTAR